jgi:hypothetical protein
MRVLLGSAIAAMVVVAGLLAGITQAIVVSQYGNGSTPTQIAGHKTDLMFAARQGGPAVYGWLYVRPVGDNNDLPVTQR